MAVDTACSSSLVTLHVALNSLRASQCSSASSSGVNLLLTPHTHAMFQVAGMLSPVGRCQTLDAAADGYVRYALACCKPPPSHLCVTTAMSLAHELACCKRIILQGLQQLIESCSSTCHCMIRLVTMRMRAESQQYDTHG